MKALVWTVATYLNVSQWMLDSQKEWRNMACSFLDEKAEKHSAGFVHSKKQMSGFLRKME